HPPLIHPSRSQRQSRRRATQAQRYSSKTQLSRWCSCVSPLCPWGREGGDVVEESHSISDQIRVAGKLAEIGDVWSGGTTGGGEELQPKYCCGDVGVSSGGVHIHPTHQIDQERQLRPARHPQQSGDTRQTFENA